MAMTQTVTMKNFADVVERHEIVILDFWAEWCAPCRIFSPVFEALAEENPDLYFGKVNGEADDGLSAAFQVRSIPTLMAFKKGELVFERAGLMSPQDFQKLIEKLRALEVQPRSEDESGESSSNQEE